MNTPYWDFRSTNYDIEHLAIELDVEYIDELITDIVNTHNHKYLKLCDIGCGTGRLAKKILDTNPNCLIHCIDFSYDMILKLKSNLSQFNNRYKAIYCDITQHIFPINYYNIIVATLVVHHLSMKDRINLYRKLYKAVSNDGKLIIYDRSKSDIPDYCNVIFKNKMDRYKNKNIENKIISVNSLDSAENILKNNASEKEKDKVSVDKINLIDEVKSINNIGFKATYLVWRNLQNFLLLCEK